MAVTQQTCGSVFAAARRPSCRTRARCAAMALPLASLHEARRLTAQASAFAGSPSLSHLVARACVGAVRQQRHGAAVAMANPRRTQRVSQQIMRELSLLMLSDKRVRSAMSPEERLGADTSLMTLASVTEVVISGDLQVAKVYVSFFGDDGRTDVAFSGLQRLEGYLRSQVGKAMQLRFVPELRFIRDEGAERGGRVLSLLSGLSAAGAPGRAAARVPSPASDDEDEEDDDESSGPDVELVSLSSDTDADIISIDSDGEVST